MKNITLKQLRYFDALSRHFHFGQAADVCAVSQPALSMQIKELETSLGMVLVERNAKRIRLTHYGEAFVGRVRDILRSVDELGDLARASQGRITGRWRIGVIPTIAPYLLPQIIAQLGVDHVGLEIDVRETLTNTLITELAEGLIDTAIVALPVSEPTLTEVTLFTEEFVLVRNINDAEKPVPSAAELRELRLLLLEEGHCFRDQALSFCNIRASLPREGLAGSSLSTLVQLVGSGIGVTLIPEMAVAVETRSAPVAIARFSAPLPTRTIGMIWRKSSPLADHLLQIAQSVRNAANRHSA